MTTEELEKESKIPMSGITKIWYSDVTKTKLTPLANEKCVYMLICDKEIVYIGSSSDIVNRLLAHKYKLTFDFAYIGCMEQREDNDMTRDMLFMESYLIGIAEPVLNFTDYTVNKFKSRSLNYIKSHVKMMCA